MRRGVVLALAWGGLLLSFVDRLVWSSIAPTVSATHNLPLSALGAFASAFFAGYVVSNVVGGMIADKAGPRIALGGALILLGLFTFVFAFTRSIPGGIAVQALMGLAAGADYSACVKLMAAWYPPRGRAWAIGILMTSLPVAVIVASSGVTHALRVVDWPAIYQGLGLVTVVAGGIVMLTLQDAPARAPVGSLAARDIVAVLRDTELLRLALVGFGAAWGTWGFAFWATALMAKGHGLSPVAAGFATTLFGAAAIVAKPAMGWLSDRMGGRRKGPIVLVLAVYAAGLVLFGFLDAPIQFQIAALLLGFFGFSWGPLLSTLIAEIGGTRAAGTATGATNAIQQMGGVLVPIVIGAVFAHTHSFTAAFLTMAAGPAIAMVIMALFCRDAVYAEGAAA